MQPEAAEDPVGTLIPMLKGQPPKEQLATLLWMQTVPEGKVISAFPHLQSDQELSPMEKEEMAFDLIVGLVQMLQRQGYQAPQLPEGYSAVGQEEIPPPAPDQIPAGANDGRREHGPDSHGPQAG